MNGKMIEFTGSLKELKAEHRLMVQLELTGKMSRQEIADEVGLSVKYVNRLLCEDELVREYMVELRWEVEEAAKRVRVAAETELMRSTGIFVKTLVDIASDPEGQSNARVSAARFGLQFAGMALEDPKAREIKTPRLTIRDGQKKEEVEQKRVG